MNSDPSKLDHEAIDPEYRRNQLRSTFFLLGLFLVLLVSVLASLRAGSYEISYAELIRGVFGLAEDNVINIVMQNNRLPRICTAIIAGAGLGVSGCILQAILRNPLASASTLGISQGAAFGAAFAIIVLNLKAVGSLTGMAIPICAFVGSMSVAIFILTLSKFRQISPEGIILAGVAISAMFAGATALLQYFANEVQIATLVFWTFGSLSNTTWADIRLIGIVVLLISIYFILHRWVFNALLSGTETAISLGINVQRMTMVNMILCCFLAATIVSYIGLIVFIGLIAPHIVRLVVGNNHVYLIPGSILAGSIVLLLSDLFSRVVISPVVLPIGAITAFLGGPIFLYLLIKGGNRNAKH
jgi:iron complex transport system permease protein